MGIELNFQSQTELNPLAAILLGGLGYDAKDGL